MLTELLATGWYDALLAVPGFLLGVHLAMILLARCYAFIDLGYCLRDFWLQLCARLAFILGITALIYLFSSGPFQSGFLAGQVFFVGFHLVIYWIGQVLARAMSP